MKKIRLRMLPLGAVLATVSAVSNAAAPDVALDACAQHVVSDLAARQGLAPKYSVKLAPMAGYVDTSFGSPSVYRFKLEAHDPKTGALVARAECDAQYDGKVITYRTLPLTAAPATLAKSE